MSATELILKVRADKSGLAELHKAFGDLTGQIQSGVNGLASQLKGAAHSGAQELAQMRNQIQALQQGLATTQQLIVDTGRKSTEAAQKRAQAAQQNVSSANREQAAVRALHQEWRGLERGLAGGLGMLWTTYGSLLPLLSGFAISAGLKKAIDVGSEFTYQMRFAAEVSREFGATNEDVARNIDVLGNNFMKLSERSAFSSTEIAQGYRVLAQAGFSASDALRIMPDLLKFSTIGEIEMGRAAEIAAGQMHAFNLSIGETPHMLDSTAKAASLSQTTIAEMGQALRQSSTVAQQYGVNIDEMNALLAVLAQRNIRGSAAGTALRNMFIELDPHTEKAKRAFRELGISIDNGAGGYKKIIPLIQEFADKFGKYDQISQARLANSLFNERGAKAFLNAMSEGRGALVKFFDELQKSDGYLKKTSEGIEQTFKIQSKEALNSFENAFIQAFQAVEPSAVQLMQTLKGLFQSDEFKSGVKWAVDNLIDMARWLVENKGLVATLAGGVLGLAAAMKVLGGAMALAGFGVAGAAVAGVGAGTIGAVLAGGLGFAWIILQLDTVIGRMLKIIGLRDQKSQKEGGAYEWISGQILDGIMGDQGVNLQGGIGGIDNVPAYNAAIDARKMREAGGDELQRQVKAANRKTYTSEDYKAADDATKLKYDTEAQARAAKAEQDEVKRYRESEQRLKASLDAELTVLKAYHSARIIDDASFIAQERKAIEDHYQMQAVLAEEHIRKEQEYLNSKNIDPNKRVDVMREIDRAEAALAQMKMQREAQLVNVQAQSIKRTTDIGQREIDAIEHKNEALKAEIISIEKGEITQQQRTLAEIDATVAKLQFAEATLIAESMTYRYNDVLTKEQELHWKGIEAVQGQIEKIKGLRVEYIELQKAKTVAENDWQAGAIKGLNDYLKTSLSTAEIMEKTFKHVFTGLEGLIFNFVKTGKFNFKDFAMSVVDDLTKVIIKMTVIEPLARMIKAALGGDSGGFSLTNADGSTNWTGMLQNAGTIGQFGYGMLSGAGSGMVGTAGNWLGNTLGTTGVLGSGGTSAASGATFFNGAEGLSGAGGGMPAWAGTAAWVAAIIAGMYANNELFTRGWRQDNQDTTANILGDGAYMPDRLFRGLGMSDRMASLLSGSSLTTRIFGHGAEHADAYGIRGDITGSGFNAETYQDMSRRGGVFRSDQRWTETGGVGTDEQRLLQRIFGGVSDLTRSVGSAIGVDASSVLSNYSHPFNVQMSEDGRPLTDAELHQRFAEALGPVLQEQVAMLFKADGDTEMEKWVTKLKGTGEEITAQVVELVGAMQGLTELDLKGLDIHALLDWQKDGESLSDTFNRIAGQITDFDNAFATEAQKLTKSQDLVTNAFSEMGIAVPESTGAFYDLVHGLDLSTAAGRGTFDTLMRVAPAFMTVSSAAQQAVAAFHQAAGRISSVHGREFAKANLHSAVGDWMSLNAGNGAAGGWTVDSTIANIGTLANTPGGLTSALEYAKGLGGDAVNVLTRMINAYGDWTSSADSASGAARSLGSAASGAANSLRDQQKSIEEWAKAKHISDMSPLKPGEKLNFALNEYERIVKKGDRANFTGAADNLLSLGQDYYASGEQYTDLYNRVIKDAERLGGFTLDYAANATVKSIDQLRRDFMESARLQREDNDRLKRQVADLINRVKDSSDAQVKATKESGDAIERAFTNAISSKVLN